MNKNNDMSHVSPEQSIYGLFSEDKKKKREATTNIIRTHNAIDAPIKCCH